MTTSQFSLRAILLATAACALAAAILGPFVRAMQPVQQRMFVIGFAVWIVSIVIGYYTRAAIDGRSQRKAGALLLAIQPNRRALAMAFNRPGQIVVAFSLAALSLSYVYLTAIFSADHTPHRSEPRWGMLFGAIQFGIFAGFRLSMSSVAPGGLELHENGVLMGAQLFSWTIVEYRFEKSSLLLSTPVGVQKNPVGKRAAARFAQSIPVPVEERAEVERIFHERATLTPHALD